MVESSVELCYTIPLYHSWF